MSWQLWDPPAIIIPAPPSKSVIQALQAQQTQTASVTAEQHYRAVYDRAWNVLQPDGRINMGNDTSASVSPYSEHYASQVEDRIWPLCKTLWDRGYLTVSSCGGHRGTLWQELDVLFVERSTPYVTVAVHSDLLESTLQQFASVLPDWATLAHTHTMSNTKAAVAQDAQGRLEVVVRNRRHHEDLESEYTALNYMMQRNYNSWSYITIRINSWQRLNLLHWWRTQQEAELILDTAHALETVDVYSL